jgi:hypothetical protein
MPQRILEEAFIVSLLKLILAELFGNWTRRWAREKCPHS